MTKGKEAAKGKLNANEKGGRANLKPDVRTRKHNDLGPAGLGMDLNTSPPLLWYRRAPNLILGMDITHVHQEKLKLCAILLLTETRKHSL